MTDADGRRRPEIDRLKGLAILGVLLIHARPLVGTVVGDDVVNRAVPVFLVLFGVTSELWWRAHGDAASRAALLAWYRGRARRLLPPLWATLAAWWLLVATLGADVPVAPRFVIATALGYLPWLGTGWFVTVILQLVVLFPVLHWGVRRLGPAGSLACTAAILLGCYAWMFEITAWMRALLLDSGPRHGFEAFYYFWIFVPARLFGVVAGMVLARRATGPNRWGIGAGTVAAALAMLAAGWLVAERWLADPRAHEAMVALLDVPLAAVLLAGVSLLPAGSRAARALAWCGRASWEIYLGQMLIHDGLHAFGLTPEQGSLASRWAYGGMLLGGTLALMLLGGVLRARVVGPRRVPTPATDAASRPRAD